MRRHVQGCQSLEQGGIAAVLSGLRATPERRGLLDGEGGLHEEHEMPQMLHAPVQSQLHEEHVMPHVLSRLNEEQGMPAAGAPTSGLRWAPACALRLAPACGPEGLRRLYAQVLRAGPLDLAAHGSGGSH